MLPSSTQTTYRSVILIIQIRSDIRQTRLFEEVGILKWKEKPEGEAKLKGSREANPAQEQAGVDGYVGPSEACKASSPTYLFRGLLQ